MSFDLNNIPINFPRLYNNADEPQIYDHPLCCSTCNSFVSPTRKQKNNSLGYLWMLYLGCPRIDFISLGQNEVMASPFTKSKLMIWLIHWPQELCVFFVANNWWVRVSYPTTERNARPCPHKYLCKLDGCDGWCLLAVYYYIERRLSLVGRNGWMRNMYIMYMYICRSEMSYSSQLYTLDNLFAHYDMDVHLCQTTDQCDIRPKSRFLPL